MNITRTAIGLSDFQRIGHKDRNGPYLRFCVTWKGWTEDDRTPAMSIPGFRAMMDADREIRIHAPLRRVGPRSTVYSCQISKDLADWILETLKQTEYIKEIGKNFETAPLAEDLPDIWGPNAVLLEKCKTATGAGRVTSTFQFGSRSGSSDSAVTGFFNGHGIQVQQHQ